jgi:hypothetical protein
MSSVPILLSFPVMKADWNAIFMQMNVTSPTISEALTTTNRQRSFSSTMIAITIKHLHPILFFNKLDNMSLINHLTLTDLS